MEFIKTFFIFIVLSFFLTPVGGILYLLFKFFGKGKQQQIIIIQQQPNGVMQQIDQTPPTQPLRWKRIWIAVAVFFGLLINSYFVMEKMN